ncbi:unnamed protein product [Gadus morhua 'NCC']
MAAPVHKADCWRTPEIYKHHEQRKVCISRPKYRDGRKAKAVKVYTINLESRYLMVQGVPAIGVMPELIQRCALYGVIEEYRPLDEYPAEEFTEVYLVKFQKLTSARAAKRHLDEKSFYGGVLHVCYVPEYETVEDTRLKLQDRRRYVMRTCQHIAREREQTKEATEEDPKPPDPAPKSERSSRSTDEKRPAAAAAAAAAAVYTPAPPSSSHYLGFPMLPFPPQEDLWYRRNTTQAGPSEDRMGSLHNAFPDTAPSDTPGTSTGVQSQDTETRVTPKLASAAMFVPRTTHLENRKRRLQAPRDPLLLSYDVVGENSPLVGPQLPEPPRLDMEDESLNTTVDQIRNTLKQVDSVTANKPAKVKKTKPRRRI